MIGTMTGSRSVGRALALVALLFSAEPVKGAVIVNEVLANEPGAQVTLEWIELYNDSPSSVSLAGYHLMIETTPVDLPDTVRLDAEEYYIICRRLFMEGSSLGFESVWGDGSGVWGDSPLESHLQSPFVATFSLRNSDGRVQLYDAGDMLVSEFVWSEPGADGVSWERVSPLSGEIRQSLDPVGCTPGFINSHTPVQYDLALSEITVIPQDGETAITFVVTNGGLAPVDGAHLVLAQHIIRGQQAYMDTVDIIELGPIDPGVQVLITEHYVFDGVYVKLRAALPEDDRLSNNEVSFVATGVDFPPVMLCEVLANPEAPLRTEWVEIKNVLNEPFDIEQCQIGDSLVQYTISDTALIIEPSGYLVLAQDSVAFRDFYPALGPIVVHQPLRWPSLNNGGDVVRLIDRFGFEADRFVYGRTFDGNYTWSRDEQQTGEMNWGRSETLSGTPGEPNTVLYAPGGVRIEVLIEPRVFSPDGDGFEDVAVITIEEAPAGTEVTLKIYDRQGRAVRTIIDGESFLSSSYQWDGTSDAGRRLPVGIYVVYAEATGAESVKKPIVIAR